MSNGTGDPEASPGSNARRVSDDMWGCAMSTSADGADPLAGVQSGYDRWAAVYDHDANPMQALEGPRMHAGLGAVRGLRVLDLGCGTGRHALWLAQHGAEVTAIDFSAGMLAEAARKPGAQQVQFLQHDLHQPLPFATGTFDRIVSGLVLEHLAVLEPVFEEAYRVLTPGGSAVISAMHPAMFLRDTQAQFTDPASGERVRPGSVPHTISAFVMAAVSAGFQIIGLEEASPDRALVARFPRAEKYLGWPMLFLMRLGR